MATNHSFGIIGGDERQIYLAKSIAADGYSVYIHGLEGAGVGRELRALSLKEITEGCTHFVFPLPVSKNGRILNAPLAEAEIILDDNFASKFEGKKIYVGIMNRLLNTSALWQRANCNDYYASEALMVGNAGLTAEGALAIAIKEFPGAICGSKCLITGFGRIGKALCLLLRALGARVECAARKSEDLMGIKTLGCKPIKYNQQFKPYDIIFNTVPITVLGAAQLSKQREDTVIIELASAPGGIDIEVSSRLGLRIINAPSLPGRLSPKTSGEYIKEAIYSLMEE